MDKSKFGVGLMMTVRNINPKYTVSHPINKKKRLYKQN